MSRILQNKCRGAVIVLMTMLLVVLLAGVGLAIDSGRGYGVKAKLNAALDAAAIAGARSVSTGSDENQMRANVEAAVNKFFYANYDTTPYAEESVVLDFDPATDIDFDIENGEVTGYVKATAHLPTTFMRVVGFADMTVFAESKVNRRALDLSLVVDNTTSLTSGVLGDVTDDVRQRSKEFVDKFGEAFDRVALIKYAFGAEVPEPFWATRGFSKSDMNTAIDNFNFGGGWSGTHYTNAAEGMWRALNAIRTVPNPSKLQTIVFFTDGAPNTFSSTFEFQSTAAHSGSIRTGESANGTPAGLWEPDHIAVTSGPWYYGTNIASRLSRLPTYYNAHDPNDTEFLVVNPSHPRRPVTNWVNGQSAGLLWDKVNNVSRNLLEDMAEAARLEGISVYTLGLGSQLIQNSGPNNEHGEDILLRMANDPRSDTFDSTQPVGAYCYAETEENLGPCFTKLASAIIRLSM